MLPKAIIYKLYFLGINSLFADKNVNCEVESSVRNSAHNVIVVFNAYLRSLEGRKVSVVIAAALADSVSLFVVNNSGDNADNVVLKLTRNLK